MKILVAVKRVVDYNVKVHILPDHTNVDTATVKMSMNPFDEIAVEAAVRQKEQGFADEVVALTVGPAKSVDTLRVALAMGADRGIHMHTEEDIEPCTVANLIARVVETEKPDLVIFGKQAIDNDASQVAQMVSALCNMPLATSAGSISIEATRLTVVRESDNGHQTVTADLPAVVSADLRLAEPRYVTLPNMMKAKKKPVETIEAETTGIALARRVVLESVDEPAGRSAGVKLANVDELIDTLRNKLKVI